MKDEGPFVLEWAAHHLVLGFDRIVVATNDCRDGTDRLLDALDRTGHVAHVPSRLALGDVPQHAGNDAIRRAHGIDRAGWLMMLDADEFLNVHVGGHGLSDLTALAGPEVDVVALHAMFFTGAPEANWRPGRVCPRFVRRVRARHRANGALKTLTRDPSRFKGIHNRSMVGFRGSRPLRALWGDGTTRDLPAGEPLWRVLRHAPADAASHRLAQYNHYGVKTRDSFMLRRARPGRRGPDHARDRAPQRCLLRQTGGRGR